ncbi:hypothetical protein FALBO_101 [Fusarium albosuccineum]|uniref:Uncharacterized protein n=1 Tax=Fusarium albosuccineum TaxID=1237068 RepID=A0A8H4LQ88_9HYPO|nr:hypothetical protein FALBO_101 [Fusarium albosuccineum]
MVTKVEMGDFESGSDGYELKTDSLATCIRVAIVGNFPVKGEDELRDRFMAHVTEWEDHPAPEFANLMRAVRLAMGNGLVNLRAMVIACTPESRRENPVPGADIESDVREQREANTQVVRDIHALVGAQNTEVKTHSCEDPWTLIINWDKTFSSGRDALYPTDDEEDDDDDDEGDDEGDDEDNDESDDEGDDDED